MTTITIYEDNAGGLHIMWVVAIVLCAAVIIKTFAFLSYLKDVMCSKCIVCRRKHLPGDTGCGEDE